MTIEMMVAKALFEMVMSAPPRAPDAKSKPPVTAPATAMANADNFADAMRETLKCYHHTAKFSQADVIQAPWPRQSQYGATQSAVVRIGFTGAYTGSKYSMTVAVMVRDGMVRTHFLEQTVKVPASSKCALENWVKVEETQSRSPTH
jgi:hypothetical protein